MNKIPYKIYLEESEMPRKWYNLRADMKNKPVPLLNPATMQPMTKADLAPVFCNDLIDQELDETTPFFDIPEEILDFYKMYRPSPVVRAYFLEKALGTPAKIYYKLINHFVEDIKLEDGVGDFRLLSQRAVKSLTQLDEYNRFSKGLYEWIGYNTKVFSYENVEREDGESKWSFSKLLNYGIDGLISFNNKPLRAMIYLGLIVFFISLLYIGYISVGIMIKGVETPGYFSTIAAILLLGGIQLISIGIVGEYIGRIYYEVKQRPKYIVQASNFKCADETNHHNITQDINDDVGSSERRKSSKTQDKKKKELIKSR